MSLMAQFGGSSMGHYTPMLKLLEGNLEFLKTEPFINIKFDFSHVQIGGYVNEEDYLNKKVKDYNTKEPGKGDSWRLLWDQDKIDLYPASFITLYNKYATKLKYSEIDLDAKNKYTLIVETNYIEVGFNIYITKSPARANFIFKFVETDDTSKVLAKVLMIGAVGKTFGIGDMDTGVRIKECYSYAGKYFTDYLRKYFIKEAKKAKQAGK